MIQTASPGSQQRFIETFDFFFQSVTQQAIDRAQGEIPDLESYIALRRDTSGCKPCWALIECKFACSRLSMLWLMVIERRCQQPGYSRRSYGSPHHSNTRRGSQRPCNLVKRELPNLLFFFTSPTQNFRHSIGHLLLQRRAIQG